MTLKTDLIYLKDLHILVVEDPFVAKVFALLIKQKSAARVVSHARSLNEAKAYLNISPTPVHITIVDVHLAARENGSTLADWMRRQAHLHATLRVCFSMSAPDVIYQGMPEHPEPLYHRLLHKPMSIEALVHALDAVWQREQTSVA